MKTPYFLKAIQLVSLKDDQFFSFLHEFAYQGQGISKVILVKAMARNNATLFKKLSEWHFSEETPLA